MSRVGIGRAMRDSPDGRVEPMALQSAERAVVTALDGSPLAPERAWPPVPPSAIWMVPVLVLLDTAVRGAALFGPGREHILAWPLVTAQVLSWLGGVGLLALPAVALAARPTPPSRRRVLLLATTLLALSEVCAVLPQLSFLSSSPPGASAGLELPAEASLLFALVRSLAIVGGVALVGVAWGIGSRSTAVAANAPLDRRSRLLARALGLPAIAAILIYFLLVLANVSRVPVSALTLVPEAFLPASAAWLTWVSLRARSRVEVHRLAWAAAAGAGLLWLAVGVGSDAVLPLSLLVPSGWALSFFSPLVLQLLGVLAVVALLLALHGGVASEPEDACRADARPTDRGDPPGSDMGAAGDTVLPDLVRVSRPPGSPRRPRRRALAVVGVLAGLVALVAANVRLVPGPTLPPSPPQAAASPTTSATVSAAQPGVVLDRAEYGFGVGAGWSPDGWTYADVAQVSATDTEVHVVSADGRRLLTLPGQGVAWVDAAHVAVAGPYVGGSGAAEVGIHSLHVRGFAAASPPLTLGLPWTVPGTWSTSMLGSGHGTVALTPWTILAPAPWSPDGPMPTFSVWSADGGLRGPADGTPVAWSPDGSRLATWWPPASISGNARTGGIVLAATGSSVPAMVMVYDDWLRTIVSFRR